MPNPDADSDKSAANGGENAEHLPGQPAWLASLPLVLDLGPLQPWQAYLFAVISTAATLAFRLAIDGPLDGQPLLVIFTVPIMLSAYLGGIRAGLLATALSYFAASYYLLPPIHSFMVESAVQRWQQFFVVLAGVIISVLNEALHRARRRADIATTYTRSLIESNIDALMTTDLSGIISDVNQQMVILTGRARAELIGMPCRNFFTDPVRVDCAINRVLVEKKVNNYELIARAQDGKETIVSYNFATFLDRNGQLEGVFATARDISERKVAETQLFESEAQTKAILAAAVDAIIIIDAKGTIESLNTATETLFGYAASEMVGQNVKMLMPAPYKAEHDGYLKNYTTTGVKKIIGIGREVVGLRKNGNTFPMDLAVSEVQTGGRRLFTGIVRDITDRKNYERTLQEKNIELEHASRMKSEFLATMSHELRTPLNAIIGFSEALKDGFMGRTTDMQHEYINDIFTSGQHLLSLINDILDLSKVEAGMMTLDLEEIDLNSLLSNSLSIIREKAGAHRITLELEQPENLGAILVDVRKTKQILYNLLSNAVKFSSDGSRIVLRARRVSRNIVGTLVGAWPAHAFPLAESEYEDFLEVCISDTGIGISQADMKKLFLAFSQIDSSLARKFEGTGLGLAMVKQLAELHGGTVAVASEEGQGACFAAWLPLRVPAEAHTTMQKN